MLRLYVISFQAIGRRVGVVSSSMTAAISAARQFAAVGEDVEPSSVVNMEQIDVVLE